MDAEQPVPISALQHFAYCPRQCGLIHISQVWTENIHTQKGRREHDRVDQVEHEVRDGMRIERALSVWSERLGLIGKCDVVEFHDDGRVYPVEYKHGPRKAGVHDDIQLCAQALCLEEMLGIDIGEGAIYHIQSRRRRGVVFDEELRGTVKDTIRSVRSMLYSAVVPPPIFGKHCEQCSLLENCLPALKNESFNPFEPLPEEECGKF